MQWKGRVYVNTYFPSWSAPTIFTAVADALEWIVKARGVRMLLDDYITVISMARTIGAATTVATLGIQDLLIKTMGCWESFAYQLYVHTPRDQLTAVARTLAAVF